MALAISRLAFEALFRRIAEPPEIVAPFDVNQILRARMALELLLIWQS
ncbi:hypothetical protein [Hyphomicrobium sp. CS1GBMeth3]|nr:hypothetical protein [Hyphomicrobium sp. CS1GBMeth3]